MKIIHYVLSNRYAGIEQHVNELAVEQSKSNEVLIITNAKIKKYFDKNLKIICSHNYSRRSFSSIFFLLKTIKDEKPNIVHTHGSKTTHLINRIKYFLSFNHVATIHGIKSNIKVYLKADVVIGVSKATQDLFDNKINIIENWYNPIFKNENVFNNNKDYFLSIGRLEKIKNFDILIKCWASQKDKLLIIGSGPEKAKLLKIIKDLSMNEQISIIDEVNIEDLVKYYQNAKALIIASQKEGGPRVALEALAVGIPVMSTPVGHMNDLIPTELISHSHSYEDLKILLKNIDILDQFKFNSIYEYVRKEYSLKNKCYKIDQVYNSLLNDS